MPIFVTAYANAEPGADWYFRTKRLWLYSADFCKLLSPFLFTSFGKATIIRKDAGKPGKTAMIHCEDSVLIRRSAHNIFDFLANPDNNAIWRSAVIASWKLVPGPIQLGSTYAEKMRFVRQTLEMAYTVTSFMPEQQVSAE